MQLERLVNILFPKHKQKSTVSLSFQLEQKIVIIRNIASIERSLLLFQLEIEVNGL